MQKVSELVSKNIGNTLSNIKTWNSLAYNALEYGVIEGGQVDTTEKLQELVNLAISQGRRTIILPHVTNGQFFVTSLTNAEQVDFVGDNSSFVGGYAGTIGNLGGFAELQAETVTGIINVVTGFGADPTGVIPASDAIQQALDSLPPSGGTVYVPSGSFLFDKSVLLPSNVRFMGAGRSTILKGDFGAFVNPILIGLKDCTTATGYDAAQNIIIEGFAIDSPTTNGIGPAHGKNIIIRDIFGINIYWHYLDIAGCQDVICEDIYLEQYSSSNPPLQIDNLSAVGGLYIFDGTDQVTANIDGTGCDGVTVERTTIISASTVASCIHLHRTGGKNIKITKSRLVGSQTGIAQDPNTTWSDLLIDGVTFENQASRLLWLRYKESNEQNSNVKIVNCDGEGFAYQGFTIDGWTNVDIHNCDLDGAYNGGSAGLRAGISIYDCRRIGISAVNIVGTNRTNRGIRITQNSATAIVKDLFINNADDGLLVDVGATATWAGLFFSNNTNNVRTSSGTIVAYPVSV